MFFCGELKLEVQKGEVEELLKRIKAATEEIWTCYTRLNEIGVLEIKEKEEKEPISGN